MIELAVAPYDNVAPAAARAAVFGPVHGTIRRSDDNWKSNASTTGPAMACSQLADASVTAAGKVRDNYSVYAIRVHRQGTAT